MPPDQNAPAAPRSGGQSLQPRQCLISPSTRPAACDRCPPSSRHPRVPVPHALHHRAVSRTLSKEAPFRSRSTGFPQRHQAHRSVAPRSAGRHAPVKGRDQARLSLAAPPSSGAGGSGTSAAPVFAMNGESVRRGDAWWLVDRLRCGCLHALRQMRTSLLRLARGSEISGGVGLRGRKGATQPRRLPLRRVLSPSSCRTRPA